MKGKHFTLPSADFEPNKEKVTFCKSATKKKCKSATLKNQGTFFTSNLFRILNYIFNN